VPSRGGISHDPAELSSWEDCVNGANVLLNAAVRVAETMGA
jgi:acetylornithine deacetylase/succinyl-diaminopimelate desuccinylase-like protein